MPADVYSPGLEGVIAGETAVSSLTDGLRYRGYDVAELAREFTFSDVAHLLLFGELPHEEELADFKALLAEASEIDPVVIGLIREIPLHAGSMDVLRSGISLLAHFDPQADEDTPAANRAKSLRLLAQIPQLIAARHRLRQGLHLVEPDPELSFAANLLKLLTGSEPTADAERAFDVSLILYAEHEFNASTFTARVIASTQSDLHSAIVGAVGALKGPLHGGANERVLEVLQEVGTPERAADWIRQALAQKRRIMGFGHRVYKDGDPRADLLRGWCAKLARQRNDDSLERMAATIEAGVLAEKGLHPNLDWPSARLYHYLGLDVDLYTPLFVASRITGWCAHVIEQSEHNRLIRPKSLYTGPAPRPIPGPSELLTD